MNIDVAGSVALLVSIITPSAAIGWFALKRYASAHCQLVRWQDSDSNRAK